MSEASAEVIYEDDKIIINLTINPPVNNITVNPPVNVVNVETPVNNITVEPPVNISANPSDSITRATTATSPGFIRSGIFSGDFRLLS